MASTRKVVPSFEMVTGATGGLRREEDGQTRDEFHILVLDAPPPASHHQGAAELRSPQEGIRGVGVGSDCGGGQRSDRGAKQEQPYSENDWEKEIEILMELKQPGNEKFKEAYESWQKSEVLHYNCIDSLRKQLNSVKNEIYQLIGFYSVFQGVTLTAVAQSSLLVCHNWWSAFFLSLLASVVTVVGVVQKFHTLRDLETRIMRATIFMMEYSDQFSELKMCGPRFYSFKRDATSVKTGIRVSILASSLKWVKLSLAAVVATLLLFSGLFLASVYEILCASGLPIDQATAPSQP